MCLVCQKQFPRDHLVQSHINSQHKDTPHVKDFEAECGFKGKLLGFLFDHACTGHVFACKDCPRGYQARRLTYVQQHQNGRKECRQNEVLYLKETVKTELMDGMSEIVSQIIISMSLNLNLTHL